MCVFQNAKTELVRRHNIREMCVKINAWSEHGQCMLIRTLAKGL